MACRNVISGLALVAAASLGGCNTYNGFRRDLGVDPVDPPRQTMAQGDHAMQPAPPPAPAPGPRQPVPVAGDISQASWAAERATYYTPQNNTVPVGYKPAPKAAEETSAATNAAPAGQPLPLKPGAFPAAKMPPPATASAAPAGAGPAGTGPTGTGPAASAAPASPQPKPAYASAAATEQAAGKAAMKPATASPEAVGKMTQKPASDGLWRVHLASHRTEWAAISEWQELLKRNPKLYGQFDPKIEWVDLKGRGSFARLLAGGWADRKEADAACAKIRGPRRYCAAMKD
ncbi:MAG TPA: SPOR domain-containing protein [Ferrovibrio sp.]|uniref:SPOR domain-containing protein n=1 Tax=Ferrovibrio sp. TaxID=1917215 RepID=UPI002ECFC6A7